MTTNKSFNPKQIRESFDDLFDGFSKEELTEQAARLLSFSILNEIENIMIEKSISKKQLAEKVGTSASYITQLFRGDRLINLIILAKIQKAFGIKFVVRIGHKSKLNGKLKSGFPEIEKFEQYDL